MIKKWSNKLLPIWNKWLLQKEKIMAIKMTVSTQADSMLIKSTIWSNLQLVRKPYLLKNNLSNGHKRHLSFPPIHQLTFLHFWCKLQSVKLKKFFQTGNVWLTNANKNVANNFSKFYLNLKIIFMQWAMLKFTMITICSLNLRSIILRKSMTKIKIMSFYHQLQWNIWKISKLTN